MSGDSEDPDSTEWQWAHIMWQRHGMRFMEWAAMERDEQLIYIASEQLEKDSPVSAIDRLAKVYIKSKKS